MDFIITLIDQAVNYGNFSFLILIAAIIQIILMIRRRKDR